MSADAAVSIGADSTTRFCGVINRSRTPSNSSAATAATTFAITARSDVGACDNPFATCDGGTRARFLGLLVAFLGLAVAIFGAAALLESAPRGQRRADV